MFVNKVIARGAFTIIDGVAHSNSNGDNATSELPPGELWVLSKKTLRRFDGNFGDYKKLVFKNAVSKTV